MYENIYLIEFFQSQECKYRKIGKIAKNAIFSLWNFGVFCNFANFELFALLGFTSTKKCVNSLSSSKNTRKMTVIKTLMARLAYTRNIQHIFPFSNSIWHKFMVDCCRNFDRYQQVISDKEVPLLTEILNWENTWTLFYWFAVAKK